MKKRNGTVEGERDWGMHGEHVYTQVAENGDITSIYFYANEFGEFRATIEWLDTVMSKEGYTRV